MEQYGHHTCLKCGRNHHPLDNRYSCYTLAEAMREAVSTPEAKVLPAPPDGTPDWSEDERAHVRSTSYALLDSIADLKL